MWSRRLWSRIGPLAVVGLMNGPAASGQQITDAGQDLQHLQSQPREGPPLTLRVALDEALTRNPELVALRAEMAVTRERPAQARSLAHPPPAATVRQWPI